MNKPREGKRTLAEIYNEIESDWMRLHNSTYAEERQFLREAALKIYLKEQGLEEK